MRSRSQCRLLYQVYIAGKNSPALIHVTRVSFMLQLLDELRCLKKMRICHHDIHGGNVFLYPLVDPAASPEADWTTLFQARLGDWDTANGHPTNEGLPGNPSRLPQEQNCEVDVVGYKFDPGELNHLGVRNFLLAMVREGILPYSKDAAEQAQIEAEENKRWGWTYDDIFAQDNERYRKMQSGKSKHRTFFLRVNAMCDRPDLVPEVLAILEKLNIGTVEQTISELRKLVDFNEDKAPMAVDTSHETALRSFAQFMQSNHSLMKSYMRKAAPSQRFVPSTFVPDDGGEPVTVTKVAQGMTSAIFMFQRGAAKLMVKQRTGEGSANIMRLADQTFLAMGGSPLAAAP